MMCFIFLILLTFISQVSSLSSSSSSSLSSLSLSSPLSSSYCISDVTCMNYIDNWNYNYRKNGMQTSTDDVFVSLCAIYDDVSNVIHNLKFDSNNDNYSFNDNCYQITNTIDTYVDLGTGIGSILLIVANRLKPKLSIGLEAQQQSVSILQKTLSELPTNAPNITSHLLDIRNVLNEFPQLLNKCDLITGNPPYLPISKGSRLPIDQQRRESRFETRGGIEDYCLIASKLLSTNGGRFVCSFPTKDSSRIELAAVKANLCITKRYDLLMGITSRDISIYNMIHYNTINDDNYNNNNNEKMTVEEIDIKRDTESNSLSKLYMSIRSLLKLNRRPLKARLQ